MYNTASTKKNPQMILHTNKNLQPEAKVAYSHRLSKTKLLNPYTIKKISPIIRRLKVNNIVIRCVIFSNTVTVS